MIFYDLTTVDEIDELHDRIDGLEILILSLAKGSQ